MQIDAENLEGGVLKLTLAGRMDARGASEIDGQFTNHVATATFVIVDMAAVNFLASIGIRMLLVTSGALAKRGGKIVLLNPDSNVSHILKLTGTDMQLPVVRTMDDARSAFTA